MTQSPEAALTRNWLVTIAFIVAVPLFLTLAILETNYLPLLSLDTLRAMLGLVLVVGLPVGLALLGVAWAAGRVPALEGRGWQVAAAIAMSVSLAVAAPALLAGRVEVAEVLRRRIAPFIFLAGIALLTRPARRTSALGFTGLTAAAALVGAIVSLGAGLHLREVPNSGSAVTRCEPVHAGRVLVIGLDGLGWETLSRWTAEGASSDYAWLLETGAVAVSLQTLTPTASPRIWTTMATGRPPEEHGAISFTSNDVVLLDRPIPDLPTGEGAFLWTRIPRAAGWMTTRPIAGLDRRCPTFWELVGAPNRLVDTVGWWCTWPAQTLPGRLVTDRYFFQSDEDDARETGATHPSALAHRLAPLRVRIDELTPDAVSPFVELDEAEVTAFIARAARPRAASGAKHVERELPRALAMDETHYAIAERLLANSPESGVSVFYFRGVDLVGHAAMHYSTLYEPSDPLVATADERRAFGAVVSRYLGYTFERIRHLIEMAGDDAVVLIVSDHGFERTKTGFFAHVNAPPGVLIARVPPRYAPEPPSHASVYDLAPTVLWLCGLPVAEDMPGNVWTSLFRSGVTHAPTIASYGFRQQESVLASAGAPDVAEEMDLLKSLGYIR